MRVVRAQGPAQAEEHRILRSSLRGELLDDVPHRPGTEGRTSGRQRCSRGRGSRCFDRSRSSARMKHCIDGGCRPGLWTRDVWPTHLGCDSNKRAGCTKPGTHRGWSWTRPAAGGSRPGRGRPRCQPMAYARLLWCDRNLPGERGRLRLRRRYESPPSTTTSPIGAVTSPPRRWRSRITIPRSHGPGDHVLF
jgi:hypothetical protein